MEFSCHAQLMEGSILVTLECRETISEPHGDQPGRAEVQQLGSLSIPTLAMYSHLEDKFSAAGIRCYRD